MVSIYIRDHIVFTSVVTKKRYEINFLNVTSCKSLAEYLSLVPAAAVGGTNTLTKTEECIWWTE